MTETPTEGLFAIVRRRWWLPVLCLIIGAGVAGVLSARQTKKYQATSELLFRTDSSPDLSLQAAFGVPPSSNAVNPATEAATNVALVSLGQVADLTAQALGHGLTGSQVASELSVLQVGQSDLVTVTATDPSPALAASLANTFVQQFIAFRASADRSLFLSAERGVQRQLNGLSPKLRAGPSGLALRDRVQALAALASLQTGNAQLVQSASVPTAAVVPRTKINIAAGALLGLLLGIALTLVFNRVETRLKTPEELALAYDLPILSVVPRTRELRHKGKDRVSGGGGLLRLLREGVQYDAPGGPGSRRSALPPSTADAFRALRLRLRHLNGGRELRSLLVTSAARGEGKSTTAWELARAVAISGRAGVLLLEADLRNPVIARTHGLRPFPGLSDVLRQRISLPNVIQQVTIPVGATQPGEDGEGIGASFQTLLDLDGEAIESDLTAQLGGEGSLQNGEAKEEHKNGAADDSDKDLAPAGHSYTMDVMVAGAIPPNPSELLDSDAMSELLRRLCDRYDCVILDAPPAHVVTDTLPLISQVSGVIIVSSLRHASRDAADRLRRELERLNAPLVGVVVNNVKHPSDYSYYGSGRRTEGAAPGFASTAAAAGDPGDDDETSE